MTGLDTRFTGVVIGLVNDVDDPEGVGRIRVSFPWLGPDVVSGWAPIAAPLGGNDRGYFYLPEIDDEALVAFEMGDFDHPFVMGFLHNGVDKPPTNGIDKHVRRIKSVAGHIVDLDDRSGSEKVHVETNGGNVLDLRDNDTTIEIATAGGQKITMTDQPAQIEVKTAAGTTATLSDAPSQIELQTAAGVQVTVSDTGITINAASVPVTVNAMSGQVSASADLTVSAPSITLSGGMVTVSSGLATFTGVVNCATLITQSVVSPSYTPGAGNLW